MNTSADTDFIISNYTDRYWPHSADITAFLERYTAFKGEVGDLLGFDCINGGSAEVEFVGKLLNPAPASRVLEVGCGVGGPARIIASQSGAHLTGIDLVARQIDSALEFNRICHLSDDQCAFQVATAEGLNFPDASFDAAYEIEVFSHIEDKRSVLTELSRVLKKGAPVVCADFTQMGDIADLERIFPNGCTLWQTSNREALFNAAGFQIRSIHNRSLDIAAGYELFINLFQPEIPLKMKSFIDGLQWWRQNSKTLVQHAHATVKFLNFCLHRKEASLTLLKGEGRQRIFDYCHTMIHACRQGRIKYEVILLHKI